MGELELSYLYKFSFKCYSDDVTRVVSRLFIILEETMETCEYCKNSFPIASAEREFGYVGNTREGKRGVSFITDPFQEEIHGDMTLHWICDECAYQISMDI